jgi:hypothetical protein
MTATTIAAETTIEITIGIATGAVVGDRSTRRI